MSNLRTRTRRRRDHDALRGGEGKVDRVAVTVHDVALPTAAAEEAVAEAVRAATGITLEGGHGERVESMFRALVVSVRVTAGETNRSRVEIRVAEEGRNTALAVPLFLLAFVTVVPFVLLALRAARSGRRGARIRGVAAAIDRALTEAAQKRGGRSGGGRSPARSASPS